MRVAGLFGLLISANIAAWLWAAAAFHGNSLLLGAALLAWSFGLRHGLDADHIAAIDNVTRKLMQQGERPLTVGPYFALGHSAVVLLAVLGVATGVTLFGGGMEPWRHVGVLAGTLVSALFLFAIAGVNLAILGAVWRTFRQVQGGARLVREDVNRVHVGGGPMTRLLRPVMRLVTRPWHMVLLGFLFGLGFDTATEVALLGLSATKAAEGLSLSSILVFPALFAAGMVLVDSADGALMIGAYDWALAQPLRRLYYNLTITLASVAVAMVIGTIELLGLLGNELGLSGRFWDAIGALNDSSSRLGFLVIGLFAAIWIGALAIWRYKKLDHTGAHPAGAGVAAGGGVPPA